MRPVPQVDVATITRQRLQDWGNVTNRAVKSRLRSLGYGAADTRVRSDEKRARRRNIKAVIDEIRSQTVCAHCGAQPIDWHNPQHVLEPGRRLGNMRSHGLQARLHEIARCVPLCRPCHMREDGRLASMQNEGIWRFHRKATHCPAGHAYDEGNTSIVAGRRRCRACHALAQRAYQERRKAANGSR
jgi:hypothetical protein